MTPETAVLSFAILLGFLGLFYLLTRWLGGQIKALKEDEGREVLVAWLKEMRGSLDKNTETVNQRLMENSKAIDERLDRAAAVIGGVQKELGHMSEIGRRMEELQDFLRSPKLRGNLGEQVLADLLAQTIPQDKYIRQYPFRDRQVVDYVVKTASGLIPIDSKFPLENFRSLMESKDDAATDRLKKAFARDVKKHIGDVADKYIRPQEGTTEFAIMYVPSEPIAYEILVNYPDLCDYAQARRVGIVSPNQFNHFLRVIMIGFEREKVTESTREILAALRGIRQETERFGEDLRILVKHISAASGKAQEVDTGFTRLSGRLGEVQRLEHSDSSRVETEPPARSPVTPR